jgi:hypothetical protein
VSDVTPYAAPGAGANAGTAVALRGGLTPASLAPEDYAAPASLADALGVIARLRVDLGLGLKPDRMKALAARLVEAGYTRAALAHAGQALAFDEPLTRALRYPEGTVTPADFARVLGDADGPARRAKLYTYRQALTEHDRTGGGPFPGAAWVRVDADGDGPPRWRKA